MEKATEKGEARSTDTQSPKEAATFICSKDTLDGVYPPLLLAINARRQGMNATVFFTFMGINVIRKGFLRKLRFRPPGPMGAIPGMAAMATWMMKKKIENAGIPDIQDLMDMAAAEGVKLVGCLMTVDMMGLKKDDFIEGIDIWTAEDYVRLARTCEINMFT